MLKKLFSQTAIYGLSATLAKFLNYLLTPYLTRIMTDSVYGEVSYFYSIIPFANVVLTLGFSTGYFRFASNCESIEQQKRLFTTLWSSVSLFALIFAGVGVALFPSAATATMFTLILVDNIAAMPNALLRQQGRAVRYTIAQLSGVVVNIVLCFWFYSSIEGASSSPVWVLLANLIASLISLIVLLPSALRMITRHIDTKLLKSVATYSLPLMIAGVMGIASDFIDRQMLRWVLPEDIALAELGIYSAVAKLAALMVIFRQMYSLGAEPFFLQNFSKSDFSRLNAAAMKYFVAIGIIIFLGIALFSDIFGLILGRDFRVGMDLLPILLLANLLSGILTNLSFWYKAADRTRLAIWITLTGVILTVGFNLLLIPPLGGEGAAFARVGATLAMVVISYVLGQKYYRVEYDLRSIGLYIGLGVIIYAISLQTDAISTNLLRWTINGVMILAFCVIFVAKERIFSLIRKSNK